MNTYLRNEVMRVMQGHKGRENAIHGRDLLAYLKSIFSIPNLEREMREVISRKDSGICSCSRGYYLAAGPAEAKDAVRYLDSYIAALSKRKQALLKAYPEAADGVQQKLFGEEKGA